MRSQEEAKKHKNEGAADQRVKRAALATAFRLHRDGIGKDWSGPKKVEEWLDEHTTIRTHHLIPTEHTIR